MAITKVTRTLLSTGIVDNSNATAITIDSSENVGIGTGSPSRLLDIENTSGDVYVSLVSNNTTGTSGLLLGDADQDYTGRIEYYNSSNAMTLWTSNSERMRIDSSGNVGINTSSPTSYANSQATLVIQDTGSPAIAWSDTGQSKDWFAVAQGSGLYFNYADGGGSGGASNVTDVLVLDNSGNVGIGTGSPQQKLTVGDGADSEIISIFAGTGSASGIHFTDTNTSGDDFQGFVTYDHSADALRFGTAEAERMRINSSGNVGIGTASINANAKLHVQDGDGSYPDDANTHFVVESASHSYIGLGGGTSSDVGIHMGDSGAVNRGKLAYLNASDSMVLFTSALERMRIDSSGRVLINRTSTASTAGRFDVFRNSGEHCINCEVAGTSSSTLIGFFNGNGFVGGINTSGSATSYNTSSDGRLKDITGAARGLEVINELNPVAYNWKADGKADEGLIAQEVMDIVPNAVSGSEEEMYQMDYSKLVTPLIKAIQELSDKVDNQQTIIDDLKTRIETLESA